MNHLAYLKNYLNDLSRSKNTPLLIELNQDEIKLIHNDSQKNNAHNFPLLVAQRVYNKNQDKKGSNIIVIDGDNEASSESFILLDALLESLRDELKSIKNITTLKETLKTAASMATGGLLNDFAGDYLDKGFDFIFDEVSDQFSDLLTEVVIDNADVSKLLLSGIEGLLGDTTGDQLGSLADNINKQALNLSSSAKSELDKLSSTFSKSKNNDAFQLTFKLLLAIAIDSPKLVYINNPHKLDDNSIGMLSLLFSFAKNQKECDKHIGLSVVYAYTDKQFHLYNEVDKSLQSKQQLLMAQRRFVQRYAMLEKPGSDIPTVAVKSSLFIGRKKELEALNRDFLYRQPTTLSVISGEPGIGKTALVNQHLTNIYKQEDIIKLTLFNEVGHSSTNTGLSSLEKSILDQAKELESRISFKDKSRNFIKNSGTKENAFKAIGLLFAGADKFLTTADAVLQRIMVDSHVDGFKQMSMGDLDSKQGDEKQRQFNNLDMAIKKLQSISSEPLPLVLFIDDIQWIDDTASEYILTRLLQQPDLYIVTTLRPSDAATILKQQLKSPSLHEYSLALLKACEVKGSDACDDSIKCYPLQTVITSLPGFNKAILAELLEKVIQGETTQYEALANSIFTALAGDGAQDVNTLFAVETINMLCDKKLYSENSFERLILDSPLRFNSKVQDIESTLTKTFSALQSKYKDSLAHANESSSGHQFNLMAYAVLEERLHLLKLYFGKQGNAAVNTLLFSSLLGAPFSSNLVKKVMIAITKTDVVELLPLKSHLLGSESETHLLPEHYAIIDEVYEILRRLSASDDKYQYRHGLLHTFLDKQFDYLLDTVFINNKEKAKDELIDLIATSIKNTQQEYDFYNDHLAKLTTEQIQIVLFYRKAQLSVFEKGFSFMPNKWGKPYVERLNHLGDHYLQSNQLSKSLLIHEKAYLICEEHYIKEEAIWHNLFANTICHLANAYKSSLQLLKAIELEEESLGIRVRHSNPDVEGGSKEQLLAVSNLAESYSQNYQLTKAIEMQEYVFSFAKDAYDKLPVKCAKDYILMLFRLANYYFQDNQSAKATPLALEGLAITDLYYSNADEDWITEHISILLLVARLSDKNNQTNRAITHAEKAVSILENCNQNNSELWEGHYVTALSELASYYLAITQFDVAIVHAKKALEISEFNCDIEPRLWAKNYIRCLVMFGVIHRHKNLVNDAIKYQKQACTIVEQYYDKEKSEWGIYLIYSFRELASSYSQNNQFNKAIEHLQKTLFVARKFYKKFPNAFIADLSTSLSDLMEASKRNEQLSDAIAYGDEALVVIKPLSIKDPELWAETYIKNLNIQADNYASNSQFDDAIRLFNESLLISRPNYLKQPNVWAMTHTRSLSCLALLYKDLGQIKEVITYMLEAVEVLKEGYESSPEIWLDQYIISLKTLAHIYRENYYLLEANEIEGKVQSLS
jgi:hypothetical protein